MKLSSFLTLWILGLGCVEGLWAQSGAPITYSARLLQGRLQGQDPYRVLKGDVVLTHQGRTMHCDSAFFFHTREYVQGFGSVRMADSTGTLTAKRMTYDGTNEQAVFYEDVLYTAPHLQLKTDTLWYFGKQKYLYYRSGGELWDDTQQLRSQRGRYDLQIEHAYFYKDVVWQHPEYRLETDTLDYLPSTTEAQMRGFTEVWDTEGMHIQAQRGGHTRSFPVQWAHFYAAEAEQDTLYVLRADSLWIEPDSQRLSAKGNIELFRRKHPMRLYGQRGFYLEEKNFGRLYEQAGGRLLMSADTLFLRADTLELRMQADSTYLLKGLNNVQMASHSWAARAKSMDYHPSTSIANLYTDPILWTAQAQFTSDSLRAYFRNESLYRLRLRHQCFMTEYLPLLKQHNQAKGRAFDLYFSQDSLRTLQVTGNSQSLYFTPEPDSLDAFAFAMNKTLCGAMKLWFSKGLLNHIQFIGAPEGTYYAPHSLQNTSTRLEGFQWRIHQKPKLRHIQRYLGLLRLKSKAP